MNELLTRLIAERQAWRDAYHALLCVGWDTHDEHVKIRDILNDYDKRIELMEYALNAKRL